MTGEEHAAGATQSEGRICVEGEARFIEEDFAVPFLVMRTRSSRISMFAAAGALLVVSVLLLVRQPWLAGFAGAVGMVFAFLGIWHTVGPRHLARQHVQGIKDDELAVHFRFDEDGMAISGTWGTSFYRYRGIHAYSEYRATILVQTGPVLRMVVPKRAFSSEQLETIRRLLRTRVKPRTTPLSESSLRVGWRQVALWVAIVLLVLVAAGVIDFSGRP